MAASTKKHTNISQTQSHRCNLSSSSAAALAEPKASSMDPTLLKNHATKSTTLTTSTKKPHSTPSHPILVAPNSSSIHNISNHFAKLYANHKVVIASLEASHPNSHFIQKKGLNDSPNLDSSCIALTKSKSQHGRMQRPAAPADLALGIEEESNCTKTKVKEKNKTKYASTVSTKKKLHQQVDFQKALLARQNSTAGGGRRKSFCCSQTELANFFSCTGVKVVAVDMPPFMQIHAVDYARKAHDSLEKFTSKTLACTLKKEFDGAYEPAWHCIVGTSFGSFVTHSVGGFMYFSMDHKLYILLFKTTVQRADRII